MPNIELKTFEHASSFRRIAAVAWDEPSDPSIYGFVEARAERLLEWIDLKRRETSQKVTVTHAVARALAIVLGKHPDVNAIVRWGNLQLRKDVDVFLQVAIPPEGAVGKADLSGACIRQADKKDVGQIAEELREAARKIRNNEDKDFENTKNQAKAIPGFLFKWVLRFLRFLQFDLNIDTSFLGAPRDPFGSAMVTSLGMMGVRMAWAPFFPMSRAPIIVLVGAVEDRPVAEDGAVVVRKVLPLSGTFDHRIIDGFHAATIAKEMKLLLENPSMMEFEDERDHMLLGTADDSTDFPTLGADLETATEEAGAVNLESAAIVQETEKAEPSD